MTLIASLYTFTLLLPGKHVMPSNTKCDRWMDRQTDIEHLMDKVALFFCWCHIKVQTLATERLCVKKII